MKLSKMFALDLIRLLTHYRSLTDSDERVVSIVYLEEELEEFLVGDGSDCVPESTDCSDCSGCSDPDCSGTDDEECDEEEDEDEDEEEPVEYDQYVDFDTLCELPTLIVSHRSVKRVKLDFDEQGMGVDVVLNGGDEIHSNVCNVCRTANALTLECDDEEAITFSVKKWTPEWTQAFKLNLVYGVKD